MNLLQNWKQKIKDTFCCSHQEKLNRKYWELSGKWNEVSMKCYKLEQRLSYYTDSTSPVEKDCRYYILLKRYKNTHAEMCKIGKAVMALQAEKSKTR